MLFKNRGVPGREQFFRLESRPEKLLDPCYGSLSDLLCGRDILFHMFSSNCWNGNGSAAALNGGGHDDGAFARAWSTAGGHMAPDSAAATQITAAVIKATATSAKRPA
jgi:hypothetical protein